MMDKVPKTGFLEGSPVWPIGWQQESRRKLLFFSFSFVIFQGWRGSGSFRENVVFFVRLAGKGGGLAMACLSGGPWMVLRALMAWVKINLGYGTQGLAHVFLFPRATHFGGHPTFASPTADRLGRALEAVSLLGLGAESLVKLATEAGGFRVDVGAMESSLEECRARNQKAGRKLVGVKADGRENAKGIGGVFFVFPPPF